MDSPDRKLPPYRHSLAGTLLAAREAVMTPLRPMLRSADVTEQQWRVLRVLDDIGPVEPTDLAKSALLFAPSVARILKELTERELVTRTPHEGDRRRAIVALSPAGKELVETTARHTIARLDGYIDRYGADRMDRLLSELRALIDAIGP